MRRKGGGTYLVEWRRSLIGPFLHQGEVIGMTDFLKHLKTLLTAILERFLPEMAQQKNGRLGILWHRVDMYHDHNRRCRLLRGDRLKTKKQGAPGHDRQHVAVPAASHIQSTVNLVGLRSGAIGSMEAAHRSVYLGRTIGRLSLRYN